MKRVASVLAATLILSSLAYGVDCALINGEEEITVTKLPYKAKFSCNLAQAGNTLLFEYYLDLNDNGIIDNTDPLFDHLEIKDGSGLSTAAIIGKKDKVSDETAIDGKIITTFTINTKNNILPCSLNGILKITDEDGSSECVQIHLRSQTVAISDMPLSPLTLLLLVFPFRMAFSEPQKIKTTERNRYKEY